MLLCTVPSLVCDIAATLYDHCSATRVTGGDSSKQALALEPGHLVVYPREHDQAKVMDTHLAAFSFPHLRIIVFL